MRSVDTFLSDSNAQKSLLAFEAMEKSVYNPIASALLGLTWEEFEEICFDAVTELGFLDVRRLQRGSQQGRDIVAVWPSRELVGTEVRFRFQCKHSARPGRLSKQSDLGWDIVDFAAQRDDEVLFVLTNAQLTNDLYNTFDRLRENNVQLFSDTRLLRLLMATPRTTGRLLERTGGGKLPIANHDLDVRSLVEAVCSGKGKTSKLVVSRYWTDPYTWFICRDGAEYKRLWTTSGGSLRVSYTNDSDDIESLSGLSLHVLRKRPLPEQWVLCTTPKGGSGATVLSIRLENEGQVFRLEANRSHLPPGKSFCAVVEFVGGEEGIYELEVRVDGVNGPLRRSKTFTLVVVHENHKRPHVHGNWPSSWFACKALLELGDSEIERRFGSTEISGSVSRAPNNEVRLLVHVPGIAVTSVPDLPYLVLDAPHSLLVTDNDHRFPEHNTYTNPLRGVIQDELLDSTEPRGPLARASALRMLNAPVVQVLDALEKAHERTPLHPRINENCALVAYEVGARGVAKYYMNLAYLGLPNSPVVAALHAWMSTQLGLNLDRFRYLERLGVAEKDIFEQFRRVSNDWKDPLPANRYVAIRKALPESAGMDSWSAQIW